MVMIIEGGSEKLLFLEDQSFRHQRLRSWVRQLTHKIPWIKRGIHSKEKWELGVKIRKTLPTNFSKVIQQTCIEPPPWVRSWAGCSGRPRDEPDEGTTRARVQWGRGNMTKSNTNSSWYIRKSPTEHCKWEIPLGHWECKLLARRSICTLCLGG